MESKKKLNILIVSWRGPGHPQAGGAEISTHEHARGWVQAGHSVTLFTSSYPGARPQEKVDGVNVIRKGTQVFGVQLEALKWYLFDTHLRFDIVVDQFHGIPFFTPLYVKEKKLSFIHEVAKEVWNLNPWPWPFNLIPALVGRIFEPLIFKLIYRKIPFMTVSQSTKEDLVNWGIPQNNITVVHNGIDKFITKNHFPKESRKTVIFLGVLSRDKGIEDALRVFSLLKNQSEKWQFWVVGKGDTRKLKIGKNIKLWGFVSEKKKFELLSRAHILINPSVREGWGLVVMEAASVGTPTVAFNVPGLRDSILNGHTGIVVEKLHSVNNMALEIINLLGSDERYRSMSAEAIKWSKKFSWKESSTKSLDLINKIICS